MKQNSTKQIVFLLFKIIYHYFDAGSDILLLFSFFQRSEEEAYPEFTRKAIFQTAITMFCALVAERLLTYFLFLEINQFLNSKPKESLQKVLKNQNNNQNKENSKIIDELGNSSQKKREIQQDPETNSQQSKSSVEDSKVSIKARIGFLLLIITYTDYFYYLYHHQEFRNEKFKQKYRNQQFFEFFIENIFFAGVALGQMHDDIYVFDRFQFIPVFSSIFSLITCCVKTYQFIYDRELTLINKVSKKDQKFTQLSNKAKLFILSPFHFQCIKEISDKFIQYPELHIESNQNKEAKIPFLKKLFLAFYSTLGFCTLLIIICFCAGNALSLYNFRANIIAAILGLPQVILYLSVFFDTYKKKRNKWKLFAEVLKVIMFYPIYLYGVANQLVFCIFVENVVFFSSIKETWVHNLYPSSFKIFSRQLLLTILIWAQFKVINERELRSPFVKNLENSDQVLDRVTQKDSYLRIIQNIGLYGLYILTIMNILYFAEQLYYNYYKDGSQNRYTIVEIEQNSIRNPQKEKINSQMSLFSKNKQIKCLIMDKEQIDMSILNVEQESKITKKKEIQELSFDFDIKINTKESKQKQKGKKLILPSKTGVDNENLTESMEFTAFYDPMSTVTQTLKKSIIRQTQIKK